MINEVLNDPTAKWSRCEPASEAEIEQLTRAAAFDLPREYLESLRYSNGGEGELRLSPKGAFSPAWFQLWPIARVLKANQFEYIRDNVPGFFAFAGNGGGEFFAFDTRTVPPWRIYMVPYLNDGELDAILTLQRRNSLSESAVSCCHTEVYNEITAPPSPALGFAYVLT